MSQSKENKIIIDGQTYYGGLNQPNLKFTKVNVDCWERIFDLLSLRDILAMSQTCQRMRQIGGHYFRENFYRTACYLYGDMSLCIAIDKTSIEHESFLRFVDTVKIRDDLNHLRTVSYMDRLSSLTALRLWHINLNEYQLYGFVDIQTNIETIELSDCSINDDSFDEFLALCPKLKCLHFDNVDFTSSEVKTRLLQRTHPMLEQFTYIGSKEMAQLLPFLERNSNINCLRIEASNLRANPLESSTVQLNCLSVDIDEADDANELLNRLKTLHGNGFFEKLRLSVSKSLNGFDAQAFFKEIASINALEVLYTFNFYTNAMSDLTQLKELHLVWLNDSIDLETMAMNLVNLERLWIEAILIVSSPLKEIAIRHLRRIS